MIRRHASCPIHLASALEGHPATLVRGAATGTLLVALKRYGHQMRELETGASRPDAGESWEWVYEQHAPEIRRYLRRLLRGDDEAAEMTQETFARAVAALRRPDTDAGMRPWLFRIATNLAISRLRHRRLVTWIPFSGVSPPQNRSSQKSNWSVDRFNPSRRRKLSRSFSNFIRGSAAARSPACST